MSKLPVAENWFERIAVGDGVTRLFEPHVHPLLRCNVWHIRGRTHDMLIDTGLGVASLRNAAKDLFEKPLIVVATHSHNDHVGGMHEFRKDCCAIHAIEAYDLENGSDEMALTLQDMGDEYLRLFSAAGYSFDSDSLMSAIPHAEFRPEEHVLRPVKPDLILAEGDTVDLGNRHFEVIHLPGHSPGSIGIWESRTGTLFSGDAIYDGPLLDNLPESNLEDYSRTMRRLLKIPVNQVFGGHDEPFGRDKLQSIARDYLDKFDA